MNITIVNITVIKAAAALALAALAACSHSSSPDASAVLQGDGYGLWAVNSSPDAWASSQACELSGSRAEEVVVVRPGSEAVAGTAMGAVKSDRGSGLAVSPEEEFIVARDARLDQEAARYRHIGITSPDDLARKYAKLCHLFETGEVPRKGEPCMTSAEARAFASDVLRIMSGET